MINYYYYYYLWGGPFEDQNTHFRFSGSNGYIDINIHILKIPNTNFVCLFYKFFPLMLSYQNVFYLKFLVSLIIDFFYDKTGPCILGPKLPTYESDNLVSLGENVHFELKCIFLGDTWHTYILQSVVQADIIKKFRFSRTKEASSEQYRYIQGRVNQTHVKNHCLI